VATRRGRNTAVSLKVLPDGKKKKGNSSKKSLKWDNAERSSRRVKENDKGGERLK